ncbi:MAG: hypothetical protein H0W09_07605 [Solirubrobacterales bacterium]|nr:hypothetical protein [Solirubrobacterales bacterium]
MLFDLRSGKRRRVVQVVFSFLALIFAVGFIGFGIGGDVSIDPAELFGGGSGEASSTYDEQIENAEQALAEDPEDERALLNLAEYRYLAGRESIGFDEETGQTEVTDEARSEIDQALDAWETYLASDPKKPDVSTADQMVQAYFLIGDFGGAAAAQEVIADQDDSVQNLYSLAYYRLADLDLAAGRKAADEAIAAASGSERKQLEKALGQLETQVAAEKKRIAQQATGGQAAGEEALQDPFGGLGDGGELAPPPTP